jgi:hypothetical protein
MAPYAPPARQHASFGALVLDEAVQHAFRSGMLPDLQRATCSLIENEAELKRAFGRFWAVMNDPPTHLRLQRDAVNGVLTNGNGHSHTNGNGNGNARSDTTTSIDSPDGDRGSPVKREGDEESQLDAARAARDDEMFSRPSDFFVSDSEIVVMNISLEPRHQAEHVLKALSALREMEDDEREYVERLVELREGLGELGYQRHSVWNLVRERALKEMGADSGR